MKIADSIYEVAKNLDPDSKKAMIKATCAGAKVLVGPKKYKVIVFPDGSAIDVVRVNGEKVHTVLTEKEALIANCWMAEARTIFDDISDLF
jgi:hypothetical protein